MTSDRGARTPVNARPRRTALAALLPVSERLGGSRAPAAVTVAGAVAVALAVAALGFAVVHGLRAGY